MSKLWVVSKKVGLCLGRTQVENVLRSFALDRLGKSNACPLAAMLITLLWRTSTHHPPSGPKGEPAAMWFLPSYLLCQLLQDRRTNLIFPLLSEGESLTITCGNLEFLPLIAGKAGLHFGYKEPPCWRAFPYNARLSSPDRDGGWQISRA